MKIRRRRAGATDMSLSLSLTLTLTLLSCLIQTARAAAPAPVPVPVDPDLKPCGEAYYLPAQYTCHEDFLCPVLPSGPTERCGDACYSPTAYSCSNGELVQVSSNDTSGGAPPSSGSGPVANPGTSVSAVPGNAVPVCPSAVPESSQYIANPPYSNYFLSTCHMATHVLLTSPLPDSNLTLIGPRLIAAFPGGNSGIAAFWTPQNGQNGSLAISLVEQDGKNLSEVYIPPQSDTKSQLPAVGVSGVIEFNSSAALTVPLLGGIRTIRDFTEGPSLLIPEVQDAIQVNRSEDGKVVLSRRWLDNVTTTVLGFTPTGPDASLSVDNDTVLFEPGFYTFWTTLDFPQLKQLEAKQVLKPEASDLISQQPDLTQSLSFLSYTQKLLAGTWRFLTYFGRDSMIASLLLQPVLSEGQDSAMEAVIGAVLERINRTDGSVCHEETLGDYATYLNKKMNVTSTDPLYTYPMIDTDYFLPIIMQRYFTKSSNGGGRTQDFLNTPAGSVNPANSNLTWGDLAGINAEKIMGIGARFASEGNQTMDNLAHLKASEIVGQWRDSTYGIGGGRIPYDVNTALVPAALYAIADLAAAGFYPQHTDWAESARSYADIWESRTLSFFEVALDETEARSRIKTYVERSSFSGPDQTEAIDSELHFYAISLQGNNNLTQVQVMHTDDCFRLFLLNGTSNQTQHTAFLNQAALNVMRTFPAGLLSDVGLLVANPAFGEDPVYAANFTTSAYHGTVVWSWQQAMMAKGFEVQLLRCKAETPAPEFCSDTTVHANILTAYNKLWDTIDANREHLSGEVWSWTYDDGFKFAELGDLPPPPGTSPTESDVRQLWSLTFLAVTRNADLQNS